MKKKYKTNLHRSNPFNLWNNILSPPLLPKSYEQRSHSLSNRDEKL